MSNSTLRDESNTWVRVCPAGNMGNGLFAARDIPQGTRIISETPILQIQSSAEGDLDVPPFCAAWHRLPVEKRKKLDGLSWNPSLLTQATRDEFRQWYKEQEITGSKGNILKGKQLQDALKAVTKRFAIFLTNRVQMGPGAVYGSGLFPSYSRINHSCIPNICSSYNPTIEQLTVHSTRGIRAGEQLFLSYINGACRTHAQRQSELDKWGFICSCHACTDPSIDRLRRRMLEIDQGLAAFELLLGQWASQGKSSFASGLAGRMPANKRKALSYAEELARLLEEQGLQGMDLCKTYRDCSKYSLDLGDKSTALSYAIRELGMERRLIGTETEHLRNQMIGAEYWLNHLNEA